MSPKHVCVGLDAFASNLRAFVSTFKRHTCMSDFGDTVIPLVSIAILDAWRRYRVVWFWNWSSSCHARARTKCRNCAVRHATSASLSLERL